MEPNKPYGIRRQYRYQGRIKENIIWYGDEIARDVAFRLSQSVVQHMTGHGFLLSVERIQLPGHVKNLKRPKRP